MSIDQAYSVPRAEAPCDLFLDGNEGALLDGAFVQEAVSAACFTLNRYPDDTSLSSFLAARWGLDVANVLVTAGGDDALDRLCRITLSEGTSLILPTPGFEMVSRYAQLAGGDVLRVAWSDAFPVAAIVAATTADTRAIVCTSPNNPTGAVLSSGELHALRDQTPGVLLIVDLAYAEFADEDLTAVALAMEDTVVVRTVSKAWGLAGLRVGYVLGPARWIQRLRVAGAPYAVSRLSLAVAEQALRTQRMAMKRYVSRVRDEREQLFVTLRSLGMRPRRSQGNFVFAEVIDPLWLRDALAGLGIAIRAFPGRPELAQAIRISCPGNEASFKRLLCGLQTVCRPEAYLFDIDGVLCDVRGSYRAAIRATAASFGVSVTMEQIQTAKAEGDANNDWILTQRLCLKAGVTVPLPEIQDRFEAMVQGTDRKVGLWTQEKPLVHAEELRSWAKGRPLAAVTGRPRRDAERFLRLANLENCFDFLVCMEDAPAKPSPAPVELALKQLGVGAAWLFGDTPDDMCAARDAGVLPIGVVAPGESVSAVKSALNRAGAARVFGCMQDVVEVMP